MHGNIGDDVWYGLDHVFPPTVGGILRELNAFAPFDTVEEWDNVGLLAGRSDRPVSRVLLALDLTRATLEEAKACGAGLIVAHHPILFHGRKSLCEDDPEAALLCDLVRSEIAYIATHTCLDRAEGGVADCLLGELRTETRLIGADGFIRVGDLCDEMTLEALAEYVRDTLGAPVRVYGPSDRRIVTVAAAPGSGGSFWREALALRAQAIVTGEISHHDALSALENGMCVLEAGHFATERPVLDRLAGYLQGRADVLSWNVDFVVSQYAP